MSQLLILFLYTLTFEAAGLLAAHIHPNHLQGVSSSGLMSLFETHLLAAYLQLQILWACQGGSSD